MRKQRAMQTMVEPAALLEQQQQISTLPIGTLPCKTAITALIQEDFITFSCPKYSYPTVHHFHCRYVLGRHVRYIVLSESYPAHTLRQGHRNLFYFGKPMFSQPYQVFTDFSKDSHSSLNMYYETEIPSLTQISLHVVLTNLVNTNFA